jgi:hypothetical protein
MEPHPSTILHSQHSGLERHDTFLHFALGLVSVSLGLLDHLSHGREPGPEPWPPSDAAQAAEPRGGLLR